MSDREENKNVADEPVSTGKSSGVTRRNILGKAIATAATMAALPASASAADSDFASPGSQYRIHPAIGIARMGNADPSTFFIGPEVPGYGSMGEAPGTTVPPYKVDGLDQAAGSTVPGIRVPKGN